MGKLKRSVAALLGRERANRLSNPYYNWLARRRTRRVLAALPKSDLCVNLGCGTAPMSGWVNVDLARGEGVDIVWDVCQSLPFPDESCSALFCEHVIEHLTKDDAQRFVGECYRVLQHGGVLRMSTPDAGKYLCSYAGDGEFLRHPDFTAPAETRMDRINQMMREYGLHQWVYDSESLLLLLKRGKFDCVSEQQFRVSAHPRMQGIDTESRAYESLYVEGIKNQS